VAEGDEIVGVRPAPDDGILVVATADSHALVCDVSEVNVLANPGRGVTVIKTPDDVPVVGFAVDEPLTLESDKGKTEEIRPLKKGRVPRGAKGSQVFPRKEKVARVVVAPPSVPQLGPADKSEGKE
jgi:DNA gyrase subunit A